MPFFYARSRSQALAARRDGVRVFGGSHVISHNVFRVAEALIGCRRPGGALEKLASLSTFTLLYYVSGFGMKVESSRPGYSSQLGLAARRDDFAAMAAERYAHVFASIGTIFDRPLDLRLMRAIDVIILGLQEKIKAG